MTLSPMMTHYLSLKEQYKDTLIFYRLGDFYEMFFEDAKVASKELDLTLTGRDCGLDERAPMCGVPYHAVDGYIAKLIAKNYKVAICEQLTTPDQQKGMVERDIVRVITPGTIIEDTMLEEGKANYLACVFGAEDAFAVAWADISTGEFFVTETAKTTDALEDSLVTIDAKEIIAQECLLAVCKEIPSITFGKLPKFESYNDWSFKFENAKNALLKQFNIVSLTPFEIEDKPACVCACGALLAFLLETQKRALTHIKSIKYINNSNYMVLDINTRRNLELYENSHDRTKKFSLLWVLDKTKTSLGARNMRKWLNQPLLDEKLIKYRLDVVEELVNNSKLRAEIEEELQNIKDIERLVSKLLYGSFNPRDCLAILDTLNALPSLKSCLAQNNNKYLQKIDKNLFPLEKLANLLKSAINDNPPINTKDGGFIKYGFNKELDGFRDAKQNSKNWLAELEAKEKELTGIKNLKISYNRVFGYFIEVTKLNSDKVPYRYVRKQTLVNNERYITDELKQIEDTLLGADEKAVALEIEFFNNIKQEIMRYTQELQSTASAVAQLDCLFSFAKVSVQNNYVKPIINKKIDAISLQNSRHPVVEQILKNNQFIANDCFLDNNENNIMVITGPNMAGKSTFMRQVALITLMAHLGCFVPCESAEIAIVDRIFTRVGASDDLSFGQSTFMVEMLEVSTILKNATSKSLLILDEIGRGTSTYDGLSIAWAVMEYIATKIRAKTLFSTHYHELTELEGLLNGVKNYRILVNDQSKDIIFLHKIARGGANKSFGIEVASLAGVPTAVTERAKQIAKNLEQININKDTNAIVMQSNSVKLGQVSFLENNYDEIIEELKGTDTNNLTPMQALIIINDLKQKVEKIVK
ncbi:MAG: DNA mismatch repair protein MutS [Clostridia bacterium]